MDDKEIIKALENEIHLAEYVDGFNVSLELLKNTLDLITRQQAEAVELVSGDSSSMKHDDVKHGEWLEDEYNETVYCSECKEEALYESTFEEQFDYDWEENLVPCGYEEHREYIRTKYCPNCGSDMRGGKNE